MARPPSQDKLQAWTSLIEQWETSNPKTSAVLWCRERNIPYRVFMYWRKRIRSKPIEKIDRSSKAWVLRKIRYLFMLERVAWKRTPEERLRIRQEKEVPIIDELTKKIQEQLTNGKILPKSKFREALGYYCGLTPYLKNYTNHAFARLDNNVAERAVRPLTIGRKNWLFFGSEDGGEAAAILLSFVQTCRGLEINPREYLEDVFRRIMSHNAQRLEELLPDQWLAAKLASEHSRHNSQPG